MIGCTGWTGYCLGRNGHNGLGWYTRGPYPYLSGSPPFTKGGHSLTNINSDFQIRNFSHIGSFTSAVPCSRYCTFVLCFTGDFLGIGISVCDTYASKSQIWFVPIPIVPGPVAAAYRLPALLGT